MIRKHRDSNGHASQGLTSSEKVFLVAIQPINEHITTDDLLRKLRLIAGGCGLRVNSAQLVSNPASAGPSQTTF